MANQTELLVKEAGNAAGVTEKELADLFNMADADAKKAALSLLKGGQPNPDSAAVFTKRTGERDIMNKLKSFFNSENGKALMNSVKNIFGGENNNEAYGRSMSVPLMAFTYFYSKALMNSAKKVFAGEKSNEGKSGADPVPYMAFTYFFSLSHYIFLLGFYFWLWRKDIRPEK